MSEIDKTTAKGKALRTMEQALIVIAPLFLGIVALPEVQAFIAEHIAWILPSLAPIIAIVTFLWNKYEERQDK